MSKVASIIIQTEKFECLECHRTYRSIESAQECATEHEEKRKEKLEHEALIHKRATCAHDFKYALSKHKEYRESGYNPIEYPVGIKRTCSVCGLSERKSFWAIPTNETEWNRINDEISSNKDYAW